MQQLTELIQIYKINNFPFNDLRYRKNLNKIQNSFKFEILNFADSSAYSENSLIVEFRNGFFENFYFRRLSIQDRKIVLVIESESKIAQKASLELNNILASFNSEIILEKSVETINTEIVSKLDIEYQNFFQTKINKLLKFISSNIENINYITPFGMHFKINYNTPKNNISEGILLVDKEFKLEKRIGSKEEDKLFNSILPHSTEKHIEFLKLVEELF